MGQTVRETVIYCHFESKVGPLTIMGQPHRWCAYQRGATTAWCGGGGVVVALQLVKRRGIIATGDVYIQYC